MRKKVSNKVQDYDVGARAIEPGTGFVSVWWLGDLYQGPSGRIVFFFFLVVSSSTPTLLPVSSTVEAFRSWE